ncbi:MAG: FHA domain-containing protein [Actinobacteria bacterium]|nr:FHA domain-containing protein [Actinomycetota bacterium]
MRFHDLTVVPVAGDGVVAHLAGAILVVLPGPDQRDRALDLVTSARGACDAAGGLPAADLAHRFAEVITTAGEGELPPFGSLADGPRGVVLFLYGAIEAHVSGATDFRVSGDEATTWVDRVVGPDVERVVLVPLGTGPEPDANPAFELGEGVVPGSGVVLSVGAEVAVPAAPERAPAEPPPLEVEEPDTAETPAAAVEGPPPPPPPPPGEASPTPVVPFEAVSLLDPGDVEEREPLPLAVEEAPEPEDSPEVAQVEGILCSREHFNSPDALYCSSCGISMVHQTHNLVKGARPPLGFLVFDDGSTFTLDADYLMGREPEVDESAGEVRPLLLDDPDRTVSRGHAELRLVGWDVTVADRGSANGTFVWDESTSQWQRLVAGVPVPIKPGARVALGRRTFVYETPHKPHGA